MADVKVLHQDRGHVDRLRPARRGRHHRLPPAGRQHGQRVPRRGRPAGRSGLTLPTDDPNKQPPRNIQATVVYDQAAFVETAVDNVRDAILIGGLFSVLILLAFLRSWRATLISALAIPTTLAITFLFLHWTGETLNLMSLGGLAVAIGLIIDDTVVVIENIARHLAPEAEQGRSQAQRAEAKPTGRRRLP